MPIAFHVPGTRGNSPGYFFAPLGHPGSMSLSGGGRQSLSASPVLLLAALGQSWITSPYGTATHRLPSLTVSPGPVYPPCSFGEGSPPWPSDRRVMVTRRVASLMNGAYKFIIFMYQMAYGYHFSHSNLRLPLLQQHARSGFSFYRGREEAVHCDRLRRLIVKCSSGRESIEAV